MGRDGKTYPATPKQDVDQAESEVEAGEELPRCEFDPDFGDDVNEVADSPSARRFRGRSVSDYVQQVAALGRASDNGSHIVLTSPLSADDLPDDLGGTSNLTDAEVARGLADRLRDARPRIDELQELLDRRAKDGANDAA